MVLKEGEKIAFEIRRHWYVLASESSLIVLLALLPFILLALSGTLELTDQSMLVVVFTSAAWLMLLWGTFFVVWTNYYLDVWVVTTHRIVDIEQFGLFSRDVSEFRLDRVQDITIEVKGVLPTLLNFGDLHVQTAGMMRELKIKHVHDPYEVKNRIIREHDKAVQKAHDHNHGGL